MRMTTKMIVLLLAALPLMARADNPIQVDFSTSQDNQTIVSARGVARNLATAGDLRVLLITENHLKTGIGELAGATPRHVYLRDPTGNLGDQFAANNWPQTVTILGVTNYELLLYKEEAFTLANLNLTNMGNHSIVVGGDIPYITYDSVRNIWPGASFREATGHRIGYNFNLRDGKGKFNFENDWGKTALHQRRKKLVATFNKTLDFQQMINIRHVVLEGSGHARVTYLAGVGGNVVGEFSEGHNGTNFTRFDLNTVLRRAQVNPSLIIWEEIAFRYTISFNVEYEFHDLTREVYPGLMYDLEDELIENPTDEDIERAKKYTRLMD